MFAAHRGARRKRPATTRRTSCGGTGTTNKPVVTHTDGRRPLPARRVQAAPTARRSSRPSSCCRSASRTTRPSGPRGITGIPAETIRRLAHEMGVTARDQKIELPIAWTDSWGKRARHRHRQPGGLPRHARPGGALQRLPDHPRAGHPDVAAGHHRPPRRLPPQGAVPAPDPALRAHAQRRRARCKPEHAAGRHAAGLAGRSRTTCSSTTTARRCASTRPSRGSTRCRCTG